MSKSWFDVSKQGLANLMAGRDKGFVILELIQNAWDQQGTTQVDVNLTSLKRGLWQLEVEDNDPEGFYDLSHAFTLYAPCKKRTDPLQRGRFNVGEKLVLALCQAGHIETTKGAVYFDANGRQETTVTKRKQGTKVTLEIPLTAEEVYQIQGAIKLLIPPRDIFTRYNGKLLIVPTFQMIFDLALPTVIDQGDGILRRTIRKTLVEVYGARDGGYVYEMGIPVVQVGDKWSYNVMQKVPLTQDRENVPPAYLMQLRVAALNAGYKLLTEDDATADWVRQAAGDKKTTPEAIREVLDKRFGKKRVAFDPSDLEADKTAINKGYTVVYGRSLTPGEWTNATKRDDPLVAPAILPAGQVFPSKAPPPVYVDDPPKWTTAQRQMAEYAKLLFGKLCGNGNLEVVMGQGGKFDATFQRDTPPKLTLFWDRLGQDWRNGWVTEAVDALLIHEFAHNKVGDHLTPDYNSEIARLGAKLKTLALKSPEFFDQWERE